MNHKEVSQVLSQVGAAAKTVAPLLPGPGAIVASLVGLALDAGAAIAAAGKDPVVEVRRLLSSVPGVQKTWDLWDEEIEKKFGKTPA